VALWESDLIEIIIEMAFLRLRLVFLIVIFLLNLPEYINTLSDSDETFYKDMPKELRCSGCELTVKVLNQMLSRERGNVEARVNVALDKVCDVERYSISEYNSERMASVCDFMKQKHLPELRTELVRHYSQSKKSTYLEFVQHICLDVTRLCAGISHKSLHHQEHEQDSVLHFDSDTHGFTVLPGRNIRIPNPVAENHDEL